MIEGGTWINGPDFLTNDERDWPKQPVERKDTLQNDPEVKNMVTVNVIKVEDHTEPMNKLLNYYSDWHKLKRSIAWILKAKQTLCQLKDERKEFSKAICQMEKDPERQRLKVDQHMKKYKMTTEWKSLTLDDLDVAESEILQLSQRQQFEEEIKALQKGGQISCNSRLFKLDHILQDGTLGVGGRLTMSPRIQSAQWNPTRC